MKQRYAVPHLLDIDQLKTFAAIADSGSFTRAADIVHKTQSAVSMQMKRLEERVGRPIFERDGRQSRLTEDGQRLLDFARRILKLNHECLATFDDAELTGRVRLGVPDDYADRYLPEILARFARSNPRAEVTVVCEPTETLAGRIASSDLDLAIITDCDAARAPEIVRVEQLLWVTAARGTAHDENPIPLALGRPSCGWRRIALDTLERAGRPCRISYSSAGAAAICAAVLAGLAVSVVPESSVRPGMRILGMADGYPALPACEIGLIRNRFEQTPLAEALATHIIQSLDNLGTNQMAAE